MNDRDMYYGYGGFMPMGGMPSSGMMQNQMPGVMMQPNQGVSSSNTGNSNYMNSWYNDINDRVDRLERQVKRLDQRLTRLETPYANSNYNNEPDNNMYMM